MPVPRAESFVLPLVQVQSPKVHDLETKMYDQFVACSLSYPRKSNIETDKVFIAIALGLLFVLSTAHRIEQYDCIAVMSILIEVMLILWSQSISMQWQAIEIFSGVGNVSAALRSHGIKTCSYDLVMEGKLMNFCGEAGFASESQYLLRGYSI